MFNPLDVVDEYCNIVEEGCTVAPKLSKAIILFFMVMGFIVLSMVMLPFFIVGKVKRHV